MKCVGMAGRLCGVFLTPLADSLGKNPHQLKARFFRTDEPKERHSDHTTECSTEYNMVGEDQRKEVNGTTVDLPSVVRPSIEALKLI